MKRNNIIPIVIFCITLFSCLSSGATLKEFIDKGDKSFLELKNLEAMNYYEEAYKIDSSNFNVMVRLARTYNDVGEEFYEQKKRDEVEVYINKAVDFSNKFKNKYPNNAEAYVYLGMSYGNLALFRGGKEKVKYANLVEDNCKKSISLDSSKFLPYLILGIYYRELASLSWIERTFANTFFGHVPQGSYEDSERYLKKALSIEPNMIVAFFHLSRTYGKMGRKNEEIAILKQIQTMQVRNFRDIYAKQKAQKTLSQM